jgi:hypothetical protein
MLKPDRFAEKVGSMVVGMLYFCYICLTSDTIKEKQPNQLLASH